MGKSTLFNRLTKTRQAIVNDEAGTTRDRQYGKSEWLGREFSVVDTGGWVVNSDDIFEEEIRKQVLMAVDEADVILFVVDVTNGVTDLDMQVAAILRRAKSPVIMVANKTDNHELRYNAPEFYRLGLGDPYCISAISGSGTGDLMDLIVSKFKKESDEILDEDIPRFAVVGRPNAGKSSIVNAFIGEERNIVTEIAGTTRDSIYTRYNKFGFDFYLVDTAGIYEMCKKDYPDILNELESETFTDLLDAGCGPAPMISLLAEKYPNRHYTGLDITPAMIEKAKKKNIPNAEFVVGDCENFPFDENAFDAIICSNSFHHYPNPQAFFNSVKRCLRPGGRLILRDVTSDNRLLLWFMDNIELPIANMLGHGDVRVARRKTVMECCKKAGLKVEKFEIRKGMRMHCVVRKI